MRNILVFLLSFLFSLSSFASTGDIRFESNVQSEIIKNCKRDFTFIFGKCNKRITDSKSISILITVDSTAPSLWNTNHSFKNLEFDDPNFSITASSNDSLIQIKIKARSEKGACNAVFAFLQQVIGVEFRHMNQTFYPDTIELPNFSLSWKMSGNAKFEKIGFHLHTLHPIELTEYLHNGTDEGLEMVMQYVDWLARNGQNYFEFNLLESIDKEIWQAHAKAITDYAHQRGIKIGVDVSMHMIQQKTFMLYRKFPSKWNSKWKQVKDNLTYLTDAGFDVISIETSSTEYSGLKGVNVLLDSTQQFLATRGVKMMNRVHVVQMDQLEKQGEKEVKTGFDNQGFLVHTVMCFGLNDSIAPVYGNKNLLHMRKTLQSLKQNNEVWYYPESTYWITFDISLPFFYTNYISARLADIEYCYKQDIQGHLTFTSGWEFGYWFVDWTIAQNCWNYTYTLQKENTEAKIRRVLKPIMELQNNALLGEHLIKYIPSAMVNDEIKGRFNLEFQPRPKYSYDYWMNKATKNDLDSLNSIVIPRLEEFASQHNKELYMINLLDSGIVPRDIILALEISSLRVYHRVSTLKAIAANGYQKRKLDVYHSADYHLKEAANIREKALIKVEEMRSFYKFDELHLEYKGKDYTAYRFGYLYPVVGLHFWKREEMQIEKNNSSPLKDNLYNIRRIIGVIN